MNAKKIVVPTYQIALTEEERVELMGNIVSVNNGEGAINDYAVLKRFMNMLDDMVKLD